LLALLVANSPVSGIYQALLDLPVEVRVGALEIAKPLLLWINDGLMAIFFLLIGLEVKREIREGHLSQPSQVVLPGLAAVGGIVLPALIYVWFNRGDPVALDGWAIPAATDIAFALGVLYLLGDRIPNALKVLLLTIAIFDDLAAIVIIALFYAGDLSLLSLALAAMVVVVLFVLRSGVHATLAGVVLALAIPMSTREEGEQYSPLRRVEHALHPWVAYGILPLFAFANAGVPLAGMSIDALLQPVPLGIVAGLFVGKQIGVFGFSWLGIRLGLAQAPQGVSWRKLYGLAVLCGIGFTMSLFISSLAFEHSGAGQIDLGRLGILVGSFLSAIAGYALLRFGAPQEETEPAAKDGGH
jgi:NhaA family Na+:H+ antiporter